MWGRNKFGECGLPPENSNRKFTFNHNYICAQTKPFRTTINEKVISIACGEYVSLVLTTDGLWSCGDNRYGALGYDGGNKTTLTKVSNNPFDFRNVIKIKCSRKSSFFLTKDNELYAFGSNKFGQLANGTEDFVNDSKYGTPQECTGFNDFKGNIIDIFPVRYGIYILSDNYYLYGIGKNIGHNHLGNYLHDSDGITTTYKQCVGSDGNYKQIKFVSSKSFGTDIYAIDFDYNVWISGRIRIPYDQDPSLQHNGSLFTKIPFFEAASNKISKISHTDEVVLFMT